MKQGIAGKIRLVSWQIDQIIDELPLLMMKLKEFSNLLYDKLSFSTFKFCFVVGASFAVTRNVIIITHVKWLPSCI